MAALVTTMKRPIYTKVESLHKRIREIETVREKAAADLAKFSEQVRGVKRTRQSHHNQVYEYDPRRRQLENAMAKSKVDADEAWEAYAQALCLNLATLIQTRLPRELRDEIYKHIWDKDAINKAQKLDSCTCEDNLQCQHWKQVPHYVKANYVGKDTSLEIVEFWERYRFKNLISPKLNDISTICKEDRFRTGKPAIHYIRRMELFLDPYNYTNPCASNPREIPCPQDLHRLQRQLLPLLEIPAGQRFTLAIVLKGSLNGVYINLLEQILEFLRPVYTNLTKMGASVTIEFDFKMARLSLPEFYTAPDTWSLRVQEELTTLGHKRLAPPFMQGIN